MNRSILYLYSISLQNSVEYRFDSVKQEKKPKTLPTKIIFKMVFLQDLFLPGGFELANYNNSRCNVKTATGNCFY